MNSYDGPHLNYKSELESVSNFQVLEWQLLALSHMQARMSQVQVPLRRYTVLNISDIQMRHQNL